MSVALLLLTLAASPLDTAKDHLKAGRLDDFLFAVDGKTFSEEEKPKAAALLGEAAHAAAAKNDELLALQFAQMALKLDPGECNALEAAARTTKKQQQYEAAEKYADRWILADPKNGSARFLRAQLAMEAGEWQLALDQLDQAKLKGAEADAAKPVRAKATKELKENQAARSTVASLERQLAEAAVRARSNAPTATRTAARSTGITLYSTSWCGYCKKARALLKRKGVDFVEKDVEKDEGAAAELAQKAVQAGVRPSGVPVIDVRGKLILGYDEKELEAAL